MRLLLTALAAGSGFGHGGPVAAATPVTAADLATNGTFDVSYEGSWTYVRLDPAKNPFALNQLGIRAFSDWTVRGPFWNPSIIEADGCGVAGASYQWRPDVVTVNGTCSGSLASMQVAYLSNATVCARYQFGAANVSRTLTFSGAAPPPRPQRNSSVRQAADGALLVHIAASAAYAGATENLTRWWLLQSDVATVTDASDAYAFALSTAAGRPTTATFCLTEMHEEPASPPPCPVFDYSATTASINGWLAEATPPVASRNRTLQYYTAWYQFWFNTEHDAGNWVRPAVTPSMSRYARGVWLWDTGFHVFALLTGGERALRKAQDQLQIMMTAGDTVGHIPRVVSPDGYETTTQPPGILTWAALVVYNRTGDRSFLATAYSAFAKNNDWYHATRQSPAGLCMWMGTDSGWDTSPRWDKGIVEAVDLNGWLHIDHLMLAEMARLLGKNESGWQAKAAKGAQLMQQRLWDNSSSLFWDRLPGDGGAWVEVVTPATFWGLLSRVADKGQAAAMTAAALRSDRLLTQHSMPCVGVSEPTFQPDNYWRGPVWVNVNWLAAVGLECYGFDQQAAMLRHAITDMVGLNPEPREYYDTFTAAGLGAQNFMWTGAIDIVVMNELQGRTLAADVLKSVLRCG